MSLTAAFNGALSGLNATKRASAVVSENIANALTPGYAKRSIELSSYHNIGPGVSVDGVHRHADPGVLANRRAADASFGNASTLAKFHSRLVTAVGTASEPGSIAGQLADFETKLISAASMPESQIRLDAVSDSAKSLITALANASNDVQSMRQKADRSIAAEVDYLNDALQQVQDLNARITSTKFTGQPTESLEDQRQILVDRINEIVPVRVIPRDNEQLALYSEGGTLLLDGMAPEITFDATNYITADHNIQNGTLSGIEINGIAIRTDSLNGSMRGGTLSAHFQIRDEISITAQAELDSVARDLVERFENPALDATLAPGAPGLFTDDGAAFIAADEIGLSNRLSMNASVDPDQGGETWRLRDGLGAAVPGSVGDARFLQALGGALTELRTPASGNFGTGQLSASAVTTDVLSRLSYQSETAERSLVFASANQAEMSRIEASQGVDTDVEIQNLMLVEQAYAANARVIEVVKDMMDTILRI